jgi:hypothetical protein
VERLAQQIQAGSPNPVKIGAGAGAGADVIQPEVTPQDAVIVGIDVGHVGRFAAEPDRVLGESLGPAADDTVAAGVCWADSALAAAGHVMRIAAAVLISVAVKACGWVAAVMVVVPVVSPKREAAVGDIETELGALVGLIPYAVQETVEVARGFLPSATVSAVLMLAVALDYAQDCPGPVLGILQPLTPVSVQGGTAGASVLIVWLALASEECWTSGFQENYLDGSSGTFPAGLGQERPAVAVALGVVKLND